MSDEEIKAKIEALLERRYPGATAVVRVSRMDEIEGCFASVLVKFPSDTMTAHGLSCPSETLALQALALFVTPEILA